MANAPKKKALLAKLYTANEDLSKQWFVYYSVLHPTTGKLKRIRVYDGFTQFSTVADRTRHGNILIEQINEKLKADWNPLLAPTHFLEEENHTSSERILITELFLALEENKHNLRFKSYSTYRSHLRGFKIFLKEKDLEFVSATAFEKEHARAFIQSLTVDKGLHRTTRNAYLVTLRTLFEKLVDKEYLSVNHFTKIKKVPTSHKPALYFQDHQKKILKESISTQEPQLWFFIQFMYWCFIRPIEIRCLKVRDIHGDKILVRGEISKNKQSQYVAIPPFLRKMIASNGIRNYPENYYIFGRDNRPGPKKYSVNHFGNKHAAILKELQFSTQHKFYSWKHTGVVDAYKDKTDLKELQLQLRHHSLDMVNRYLKDLGVMDSNAFKNSLREL